MSSDEDTRRAERAVEDDGRDIKARFDLTKRRLLESQGPVLWWHGRRKPHDSAAKVELASESDDPMSGRKSVQRQGGWAVAISSIEDLVEFSMAMRSATLLDLGTGGWVRISGRRTSSPLVAHGELTTLDAWGRPRETGRSKALAKPRDMVLGFGPAVMLADAAAPEFSPSEGADYSGVAVRWRAEPLYDTEYVRVGDPVHRMSTQYAFFQNTRTFATYGGPSGGVKYHGLDTNLVGMGGALPAGMRFEATGLSVIVCDEGRRPLPERVVSTIASSCYVEFRRTQTNFFTIPGSEVVVGEGLGDEPTEAIIMHPAPPAFPFAWPAVLEPLENFSVYVTFPRPLPDDIPSFYMKAVLSGFFAKGLAG